MTTTPVMPAKQSTLIDRLARWVLDADGDLYGDERERSSWYEGITIAAMLQWLTVPWAAAVLVWTLGRPAVLPLAVVLAATYLPMLICTAYMRGHRVDPTVRSWTGKSLLLGALFMVPYTAFVVGCFAAYADGGTHVTRGAIVGAAIGGAIVGAALSLAARRRRRREAADVADVD